MPINYREYILGAWEEQPRGLLGVVDWELKPHLFVRFDKDGSYRLATSFLHLKFLGQCLDHGYYKITSKRHDLFLHSDPDSPLCFNNPDRSLCGHYTIEPESEILGGANTAELNLVTDDCPIRAGAPHEYPVKFKRIL